MPVDASIYGQIQQPRAPNRLADLAQVMQIQGMQQQGQLGQLKMDEYRSGQERTNRLNQLLSPEYETPEALENALLRGGFPDEASKLGKNRLDAMKAQADAAKAQEDILKSKLDRELKKVGLYRDAAQGARDPASAANLIDAMYSDPDLKDSPIVRSFRKEQWLPKGDDPASFDQWRKEFALGATNFIKENAPKVTTQNLGGTSQMVAVPGLGGAPQVLSSTPMTMTPGDVATDKRQREEGALNRDVQTRAQNLTDQRARDRLEIERGTALADAGGPNQAALTKQFGKAPPNFRWKPDGTAEAIPGGPADIKSGELGAKRDAATRGGIAQADRVIAKVDEALSRVGIGTAGFVGSIAARVPGTPATNLRSDLETIKSNLGFAELQAMRDASPTGGALGAIAVQELIALQSTVASLDPSQSPEKLRSSLDQVRRHYENWKGTLEGRLPAPGAGAAGGRAAPGQAATGRVVDFGSLK
jgi:hypothetical protein